MATLEVVGYKGVVGNATYQWLLAMKPRGTLLCGRDQDDQIPLYTLAHRIISFVCVPEAKVKEVCYGIAEYADLIVIRSTVPPGTCQKLQDELMTHVCHNPEFLREVSAVADVFTPAYHLIGACCQEHAEFLKELYEPTCVKTIVTDTITSELIKIATNNYLACLISFWNEIEAIAQASGVSGHKVGAIASLDPRVVSYGAKYHHQFGGKCLPKELKQMIQYAESVGVAPVMLEAIQKVNNALVETT